jgi:cation diffusion facilitator CzcD-associated flavoprotein CzcO
MLKTLRDRGLKTYIFEAGNDTGGTWRWNCYPGAGVDSEVPEYEFSWPEVWKTWNWPNNYPNYENLRSYFDHVDKVIGVKKDCAFNTVVVGAHFDQAEGKWNIRTEDGRTTKAKYLVLGTGFVSIRDTWCQPRLLSLFIYANSCEGCQKIHPRLARNDQVQGRDPSFLVLARRED